MRARRGREPARKPPLGRSPARPNARPSGRTLRTPAHLAGADAASWQARTRSVPRPRPPGGLPDPIGDPARTRERNQGPTARPDGRDTRPREQHGTGVGKRPSKAQRNAEKRESRRGEKCRSRRDEKRGSRMSRRLRKVLFMLCASAAASRHSIEIEFLENPPNGASCERGHWVRLVPPLSPRVLWRWAPVWFRPRLSPTPLTAPPGCSAATRSTRRSRRRSTSAATRSPWPARRRAGRPAAARPSTTARAAAGRRRPDGPGCSPGTR